MINRQRTVTYIIFGLIVIGILSHALAYIIPILVFGVIFLLYKFPPNRWRMGRPQPRFTKQNRKRNATFRVINGSKDGPDEPPTYH